MRVKMSKQPPSAPTASAVGPCPTLFQTSRGWSGGAKVLGKLSVPGRPTTLDDSRARAYFVLAVGAGGGCLDIFSLVYLFSFSSSLSLGDGPI